MTWKKEGLLYLILNLALIGIIGVKHGGAYLNRVPAFDPIAYEDASGQHEWSPEGGSTLVVFFRTDCPACKKGFPVWEKLYRERCTNLRFLFLSAEPLERVTTSKFVDTWKSVEECEPPAVGRAVDSSTLKQTYRIQAVPMQFLVGKDGTIQAALVGGPSEEQVTRLFGSAQ